MEFFARFFSQLFHELIAEQARPFEKNASMILPSGFRKKNTSPSPRNCPPMFDRPSVFFWQMLAFFGTQMVPNFHTHLCIYIPENLCDGMYALFFIQLLEGSPSNLHIALLRP